MVKIQTGGQIKGKGQVYLVFLLSRYCELNQHGYTMQLWGDIVLEHPELFPKLPKDAFALNWGYESDHHIYVQTKVFQKAGIPNYVCPGTSSWNSIAGRTDNMFNNIRNAALSGLNNGVCGFLITDWGDNGHGQQLPISYPGFAAGAAHDWGMSSNNSEKLPDVLNQIILLDESGQIGSLLIELGDLYKTLGLHLPNSSPLFWILQEKHERLKKFAIDNVAPIYASQNNLSDKMNQLEKVRINRVDENLILKEMVLTIQLLQHAGKRALSIYEPSFTADFDYMLREIYEIKVDFSEIWLKRNRQGGLADSLARFDILINAYQSADE